MVNSVGTCNSFFGGAVSLVLFGGLLVADCSITVLRMLTSTSRVLNDQLKT